MDFYGLEPAKINCEFMYNTSALQIRFDVISNTKGKKEDRNTWVIFSVFLIKLEWHWLFGRSKRSYANIISAYIFLRCINLNFMF